MDVSRGLLVGHRPESAESDVVDPRQLDVLLPGKSSGRGRNGGAGGSRGWRLPRTADPDQGGATVLDCLVTFRSGCRSARNPEHPEYGWDAHRRRLEEQIDTLREENDRLRRELERLVAMLMLARERAKQALQPRADTGRSRSDPERAKPPCARRRRADTDTGLSVRVQGEAGAASGYRSATRANRYSSTSTTPPTPRPTARPGPHAQAHAQAHGPAQAHAHAPAAAAQAHTAEPA